MYHCTRTAADPEFSQRSLVSIDRTNRRSIQVALSYSLISSCLMSQVASEMQIIYLTENSCHVLH